MKLSFEFSHKAAHELEAMKESSGCATLGEMFNNALTLWGWAVQQAQAGHNIGAFSGDGFVGPITMPALNRIRPVTFGPTDHRICEPLVTSTNEKDSNETTTS